MFCHCTFVVSDLVKPLTTVLGGHTVVMQMPHVSATVVESPVHETKASLETASSVCAFSIFCE